MQVYFIFRGGRGRGKIIEGSVSLYSKYPLRLRALSDMGIGWN